MKVDTLIETIVKGTYSDEELASISNAVRTAQDLVKQRRSAILKATLKVGDKVTLSGLSPKGLNGLTATVIGIAKSKVKVEMPTDYRAGRFSGAKGVGVPLTCVIKNDAKN